MFWLRELYQLISKAYLLIQPLKAVAVNPSPPPRKKFNRKVHHTILKLLVTGGFLIKGTAIIFNANRA
jgi:hypothetical protein